MFTKLNLITYALLAVAVVILTGCKKTNKKVEMPLASQGGENTMGCYVNSVLHSYRGEYLYASPDGVRFIDYTANYQHCYIRGSGPLGDEANGDIYINAYMPNLLPYTFYPDLYGASGATSLQRELPTVQYLVKPNDPFNFVFFTRIDNSVAAGQFQFRAYSADGDSVYITHGRFDIAR